MYFVNTKNRGNDYRLSTLHDDDYGKYVNKYNLESSVIKHGFMSAGEDMNSVLNKCSIYMNSSTTEGQCLAAYESVFLVQSLQDLSG